MRVDVGLFMTMIQFTCKQVNVFFNRWWKKYFNCFYAVRINATNSVVSLDFRPSSSSSFPIKGLMAVYLCKISRSVVGVVAINL